MPVNDAALGLMGGTSAPPDAGSTAQIQSAIGTPRAVDASLMPDTPSVNAVGGGAELLPRMAYAVEGVESNHHHMDPKTGKVLTSSAGALGVMQVMPGSDWAKRNGLNLLDEDQNRRAGTLELEDDYKKYGNWNDALMAYNWGQGNVDKWIAGGRTGKVPAETQRYVPAVLARLGMSPGAEFVNAREGGDVKSNALELMQSQREEDKRARSEEDDESRTQALLGVDGMAVNMSKEAQEETTSFMYGGVQGLRDLVAGPVQAASEVVAPEFSKAFTQRINEMDAPFEGAIQAHSWANFAGQTIGAGMGIAAAARLLGPVGAALPMAQTMTMAARSLPAALRAAGVGAAFGATSFNKDQEGASRLAEAALGGTIGLVGQQIARGAGAILQSAADKTVVQTGLQMLQDNFSKLEPSLSGIKDAVLERYRTMTAFRDKMYDMRDSAGRVMQGYPSGYEQQGNRVLVSGLADIVNKAIDGEVGRQKASDLIKGTARELASKLGLDEQTQAVKIWEQHMKVYEKEMEAFAKGPEGRNLQTLGYPYLDVLQRRGVKVPEPPEPLGELTIPAGRMAEARAGLERAARRASTIDQRSQIRILKGSLDDTAAKTAREAGVKNIETYERRQVAADKFNKEKIVPLQEFFGKRTVREAGDMSKADVYNNVIKVIEGKRTRDSREAQEALGQVLGQKGREEARKAIFTHIMRQKGLTDNRGNITDVKKITGYIRDHGVALETLLGRDEFARIKGIAGIAETMATEHKQSGLRGIVQHHPWLFSIAGLHVLESAIHGDILHGLERGGALAGAAIGLEAIRGAMSTIQSVPRIVGPLLPRAARTQPNSPEMKRIIQSIDAAMGTATRALSRTIPQEVEGGDNPAMVFTGPQ